MPPKWLPNADLAEGYREDLMRRFDALMPRSEPRGQPWVKGRPGAGRFDPRITDEGRAAARRLARDIDPLAAAMAKAAASDAGREVTASAIQAHGGIGFTWEADVHWLFKRAQLDAALLGDAKQHRARLAGILAEQSSALGVA